MSTRQRIELALGLMLSAAGTATAAPAAKTGIQWVKIASGTFMMGDESEANSKPRHEVAIKSFQMAKTLVTNKQYKACVTAGKCTAANSPGAAFEGDDQPVVGLDWNQAQAFSKWAGGRLPTEAEWEYAARSQGKDRIYPWGDEKTSCSLAATHGCGEATATVCSKPQGNTAQGLCDMAGNAWEWLQDGYHDSYNGAPSDGSAWEGTDSRRAIRGGDWFGEGAPRSTYRLFTPLNDRGDQKGFRPAR